MTQPPPPSLKQADSALFKTANRAVQLENAKPIVSYWCKYYVVNQILARQLHTEDPDILNYTTSLIEGLEQTKEKLGDEEAITDDAVAKVYIEQFAQETLDRAQKVIRANKCTQQTANTFDAAATFLNLLNIWGPLDAEAKQKAKYAKWNTLRILKAIKEGTDPNESNPKPEPETVTLDADDLDSHDLAGSTAPTPAAAPGEGADNSRGDASLPQNDLVLPDAPSVPPETRDGLPGYFHASGTPPPSMPSPMSPPLQQPGGPEDLPQRWTPTPPAVDDPVSPALPPTNLDLHHHGSAAAPTTLPPTFAPNNAPTPAVALPPITSPAATFMSSMAPSPTTTTTNYAPSPHLAQGRGSAITSPVTAQNHTDYNPGSHNLDDDAINEAKKHSRWAVSALNFDDVPTAIKELRIALQLLGAR